MKQFIKEFKEFISRGNVMDMAVGIIIGGAFTSIVSSLVNDIINPNTTKTVYITAEYTGADAADDIFQNQFGFTISFGQK